MNETGNKKINLKCVCVWGGGDYSPKQTENLGGEAECDRILEAFLVLQPWWPGHCYQDLLLTSRSEGQERTSGSTRKALCGSCCRGGGEGGSG